MCTAGLFNQICQIRKCWEFSKVDSWCSNFSMFNAESIHKPSVSNIIWCSIETTDGRYLCSPACVQCEVFGSRILHLKSFSLHALKDIFRNVFLFVCHSTSSYSSLLHHFLMAYWCVECSSCDKKYIPKSKHHRDFIEKIEDALHIK